MLGRVLDEALGATFKILFATEENQETPESES
jgi:hypothetical protein